MADWSSQNITLTTKGASALSKVQAGSGSLTITRVVASEQYVAESTLREVTSLSVENLPLTIIDRHEVQDGGSVIQVQLSNLYLGNAFTLNEIGVFATHSDNPSEEFLYIIAQVDADTGDKIPVYATTPVTATYDIYLYNVGADNVQITISSAGLVTYEALNQACDIIQRNTAYEVDDIMHSHSLKKGLAIKCTVAGTTKSTDTDLSHKEVGDTVEDGTSQWVVIAPTSSADLNAHNHSLDAHPELVAQILESGGVNVIKRSHEYAKGDIAYSNKIPSWAFLECTVAGISSDGWYFPKPSEISVNDTIVDGTVTWKVRKVGSGEGVWEYSETDNSIHPKDTDDLTAEDLDSDDATLEEIVSSVVDEKLEYIPIGTVLPFSGNSSIPTGYLLCNGAAVGRSQYSKLFEAIGTTYGEGDGFSTFNLPDLTDKFIEGSLTAGQTKSAGLPNITGGPLGLQGVGSFGFSIPSGAFKSIGSGNYAAQSRTDNTSNKLELDASLSNPIYGNSDTVQPPALTMRYIIKAFNGMTHESALVDVTQFGQAIANKADKIDTAEAHNAIYRGKDLTEYFNSGNMSADIALGNWKNIYVGDYIYKDITIDGVTYEHVKFVIMHIDYHLHKGDTETTEHHVVIMPEEALGNAQMNSENTTTGGYVGSKMWTEHIPKVVAGFINAFGAAHILEHREMLSNAMDANLKPAGYNGWSGASSAWGWFSVKVNLANENMVHGAPVVSSSLFDTGECTTQLAAFALNPALKCSKRYYWWLRSVASVSFFCTVGSNGNASNDGAAGSGGVRPIALLK